MMLNDPQNTIQISESTFRNAFKIRNAAKSPILVEFLVEPICFEQDINRSDEQAPFENFCDRPHDGRIQFIAFVV